MKKTITSTFILFLFAMTTFAQPKELNHADRWEKFQAEKVAFLTSKLELTPDEAQKFWPVYNQMEKERWEIQKLRREIEERVQNAEETMSDNRIKQLTREVAGNMQKEADIMKNYNEKLLEVLTPRKVLRLNKAENEFRLYMIKKFRDEKREGK